MRILIACEESQAVTIAFRKLGFVAYSCDVQDCSGGFPQWHIKDDVLKMKIINDGWDCMIAFPPCTHLAVSGAKHFQEKRKDGRQKEGIDFFMALANAPIKHKAIENPVGIMSSIYRKPDQIISPHYFGDKSRKSTCLWLTNLPKLVHAKSDNLFEYKTHVEPELYTDSRGRTYSKDYLFDENGKWCKYSGQSTKRSKTYTGIANAMAEQWGDYLTKQAGRVNDC